MPGPPLRQQQRPRRVLAELRREERRRAELPDDERLHLVRDRAAAAADPAARSTSGNRTDEPVVAPQRLDVDAGLLADLRRDGHRPRRVDPSAARRQHADAPVAELVAHALDDDRRRRRGRRAWPPSDRAGTAAGSRRRARRDRDRASADRRRPAAACAAGRASGGRSRGRARAAGRRRSPFQNGILPGSPGAGDTSTRSCVISSMRHDEAPRTNVSPTRLSNTISSSSSPTRAAPGAARRAGTRRTVRDRESCRRWRSRRASRLRAP